MSRKHSDAPGAEQREDPRAAYRRYRAEQWQARQAYRRARAQARRARAQAWREQQTSMYQEMPSYMAGYRRRGGPRRGILLGVCAYLADYLWLQTWVVRVAMITGLIFMPTLVLPAYLLFGIGLRIWLRVWPRPTAADVAPAAGGVPATATASVSASASASLSKAALVMQKSERRLREMEAYVTSGRYDLQRQLGQLDR